MLSRAARIALTTALFGCAALASNVAAQEAGLESRMADDHVDTGRVSNDGDHRAVIASFAVEARDATWIRLYFANVELSGSAEQGNASLLRITSYLDGATQELSAANVVEWRKSSAYFNGDSVQVEILADPHSGANRVVLEKIELGVAPLSHSNTQCGPTDDRVPSSDKRACRALPVGCTAWMIDDCTHCFLTAGHCCCGSLQVMEFNVPQSTSNGSLVHPPPQDQYSVDPASTQSEYVTIGRDFTYFGCFKNSNTGLTPYEAQGAFFPTALPPNFSPSVTIRITGYGIDSTPSTMNQVQQTSTGPYASFSGTTVGYQCDTEGGNSGSPVIWEQAGVAVGIHTNGGCTTSGSGTNTGTGLNYAPLAAALASPLGVCKLTASATTYCTAKTTSNGCSPTISFTGLPTDTCTAGGFTIFATHVMNQKNGLLFYGFSKVATPLFGGTLCVGGTKIRTPMQNSGGSASGSDCSGAFAFDMCAWIAGGNDAALIAGKQVEAQYWFRDPGFSAPNNVGFTNAVSFVIGR